MVFSEPSRLQTDRGHALPNAPRSREPVANAIDQRLDAVREMKAPGGDSGHEKRQLDNLDRDLGL